MSKQTKLPLKLTYAGWTDSIRIFWDNSPPVPVANVDFNALNSPNTSIEAMRPLFRFLDLKFDSAVAEAAVAAHLDLKLLNLKARDHRFPQKIAARYEELKKRR